MNAPGEAEIQDLLARCIELALEGRPEQAESLLEGKAGAEVVRRRLKAYREAEGLLRMSARSSGGPSAPLAVDAVPGFEILGRLGEGSAARVYLARQDGLDRPVALKVMTPKPGLSRESLERFSNEGKALARIRHRHVVSVHAVGKLPGEGSYIAMEYVRGAPLSEVLDFLRRRTDRPSGGVVLSWIADRARRRERELGLVSPRPPAPLVDPATPFVPFAVGLALQVAAALHAAHGHRLIHRDIKPSNILLGEDGCPVVVDFGLTLEADRRLTVAGEMLGTPLYMPPECLLEGSGAADARSDVYSLGVTLYELLAGAPPFNGRTVAHTLRLIETQAAPPIRRLRKDVPRAVEAVVLRALQKSPSRRPPSAEAFAADLSRALSAAPARAGRTAALACGLALGGMAFAGVVFRRPAPPSVPAPPPPSAPSASISVEPRPVRAAPRPEVLPRPRPALAPAPASPPVPAPASPPVPAPASPPVSVPAPSRGDDMHDGEVFLEAGKQEAPFTDPGGLYSLPVPALWTRVEDVAANMRVFRPLDGRGNFVVRIYHRGPRESRAALLERIFELTPGKVKILSETETALSGRPMLRRRVLILLKTYAVKNHFSLVEDGSTAIMLNGYCREEYEEEFAPVFERMTAGFRLLREAEAEE